MSEKIQIDFNWNSIIGAYWTPNADKETKAQELYVSLAIRLAYLPLVSPIGC